MPVPSTIADLSTSEASNHPLDTESITATTRPSDYLRAHAAILRTLAASDTIAAGATVDLSTKANTFITLTGVATTISALGTVAAGVYKWVIYNAAHTLTHNATSLILMGGASRTVAAGDASLFVSEGSGNWRELSFGDASGYQPLDAELTAIAALAVTDGNFIVGNGSTWVAESGATARTSLGVVAASDTTSGLVELATSAETITGTDTARATTPAGIAAALTARTAGFGSVWVGSNNGYGSTNTAIRRFSTTHLSQGTDITYADSAANGASFTINTDGVYSISYTDSFTGAGDLGVSLNSAQLTTGVASITDADRLTMCTTAAGSYRDNCSVTVPLSAGDVIRPHAGAAGGGTSPTNAHFTITRIA